VTMAKGTHRQWPLEGGWRHIVAFVLAVLAIAPRVWAAPGDLDPSFGGTGVARTVIRGRAFVGFQVAVVRQDDGKLVVAGGSVGRNFLKHPPVFTLVRYRPDGTRDKQFGSSGIVATGRGKGAGYAAAVVQQADGKLVAAGFRDIPQHRDHRGGPRYEPGDYQRAFALVRYDARGRPDKSFGAGTGTVITVLGSGLAGANALVQQADGKLVAAGFSGTYDSALALVRYEPDGSVDPSFGTGTVLTPGGSAGALTQQADGKLLAAGFRRIPGGGHTSLVVRYDSNGQLDPEFGAGTGIVSTPLPGVSGDLSFSAILQQADGKIIAVGTATGTATSGGQSRFAVIRYDTDGSLDPTFGGGMGIVTTLVRGDAIATAAVQQPDGKIIVAGYSNVAPITAGSGMKYSCGIEFVACETQFTLVRYEIDGTLDKSFGAQNSGTVTSPPGFAIGLLQQPDGRLVAAGFSSVGKHGAFTVVRYLD
jgi:uncharacterized delta-60 repeat protein